MQLTSMSLRTTRWGTAATAALTATAICAPATVSMDVAAPASRMHPSVVSRAGSGFSDSNWGDSWEDYASKDSYGQNQAAMDPGSLYTVSKAIGARGLWSQQDRYERRLTGQGVSVAVLDSGVNQVAGLNGKVTYGPDLSVEGNGVSTQQDTFGHGTFMAGIIAGRGTTASSSDLATAPANVQLGVAPDANILALKLATRDGSTDVSQVIAALDWVTQHPVQPDGTRVRVINLSYGTNSAQSYLNDPLAAAAENAWKHGIVVVTSAGNNGSLDGHLTDPAIDPYVIAVGATDNNKSLTGWANSSATVASFSQVGSAGRHVDLVAPGTSLVSTRAPGSSIDVNNPAGVVAGDSSGKLFRGSGTSQAAAVVSGSAALLLQANPDLTPDQVKYALTSSANPVTKASALAAGAGTLDLAEAFLTVSRMVGTGSTAGTLRSASVQSYPQATGLGSIDQARGGNVLVDASGVALTGEIDVQGIPWRPAAWWAATSTNTAWVGGRWMGTTFTGDRWATSTTWAASRWSASRWSTANWASTTWTASRWSASRWSSALWLASRWSDADWS